MSSTQVMAKHLTLTTSVLFLLAAHCSDPQSPKPSPSEVVDTELCGSMCEHLRALACPEGEDYYDSDRPGEEGVPNATCEDFCVSQQDAGVFINPRCVMQAPTCEVIEDYRQMDCSEASP